MADPGETYRGYFDGDEQKLWYESAADAKADNIVRLAAGLRSPPQRVLDVGAGSGAVVQRLSDRHFAPELHAVEISESGLTRLRARLGAEAPALREVRAFDGVRIPYPDDHFDLAVLSHVLEHVDHPRLMLWEIRRVARSLIVEVPLEDVPARRTLERIWAPDATGHINYYRRATFLRLLQTAGWRVESVRVDAGSEASARLRRGSPGAALHRLKNVGHRLLPRVAEAVLSYHCAALCSHSEHGGGRIDTVRTSG